MPNEDIEAIVFAGRIRAGLVSPEEFANWEREQRMKAVVAAAAASVPAPPTPEALAAAKAREEAELAELSAIMDKGLKSAGYDRDALLAADRARAEAKATQELSWQLERTGMSPEAAQAAAAAARSADAGTQGENRR